MLLIFLVFYGVLFGMLQLRVIAIWFCLECCHYVYMQYALLHFQQRVSIFQHEFCSCLSSHDLQTIVFEKNAIRKKSESLKKMSKKVKCKPTFLPCRSTPLIHSQCNKPLLPVSPFQPTKIIKILVRWGDTFEPNTTFYTFVTALTKCVLPDPNPNPQQFTALLPELFVIPLSLSCSMFCNRSKL